MRILAVSLLFLAFGNMALAEADVRALPVLPVTEFIPESSTYTGPDFLGGTCNLSVKKTEEGYDLELWIHPNPNTPPEKTYSKHVLMAVTKDVPETMSPEIEKLQGFHRQEDFSYDGKTLISRVISIKWFDDEDPKGLKNFHYWRFLEMDTDLDFTNVTRIRYSFKSESASEGVWTETISCSAEAKPLM